MASALGVESWNSRRGTAMHADPKRRPPDLVSESMVTAIALRLLSDTRATPPDSEPRPITPKDVERFAALALEAETPDLLADIDAHLAAGTRVEVLFVDLLAPAARRLGEGWEADRLDFVEVTMALWRLQEALREVSARTPSIARPTNTNRFAVFSTVPGEQHSFGTSMVQECFARAGWGTELLLGASRADLFEAVGGTHCDLVGLTVNCDCHIETLSSLISAVRNVSQNPGLLVMIGGRVLVLNPSLAASAGADGTAATAIDAVRVAEDLVEASRALAER